MAGGSKDLRYNVAVDASDASASLKKLSSDVKKTAKDIEGSFDDSASAGDKFKATVDELSSKLESEFKSAATAADKLGTALKDAGSKMDVGEAVADLTRMGFTFDEITADADKFATSLKQLDDVKLAGVHELDSVAPGLATKLDEVNKSADSSKSVLANMIGNSAQDLGALGGIAGSTGVAIGQMGEYIADAVGEGEKLGPALLNMAKVAGPMAGLAAATYLVSNAMKAMGERDKLKADDVKAFTESIIDGGDAVQELAERLTDAGEILGDQKLAKGMEVFGRSDAVKDMTEDVARAGLTVGQFSQLVIGGRPAIEAWGKSMTAAGADGALIIKVGGLMLDMADDYAEGVKNAAAATAFFGKTSVDEYADAADALQGWTEATAKGLEGLAAFDDAAKGTDWGGAALDGAVTAMGKFSDAHFGLVDIAAASEEAFDKLSESVDKNGKTFDITTEKGRANQAALEDVARTLDTKLAAAYKDAGGDIDVFKGKASALAAETLTRLQKELGLSDKQTAELAVSLGLLPEDIETRYKLSGDEEAKLKIGLLSSAISALPVDVQAKVTQQIIVGDYQGALATVQGYYNRNPADVKTEALPPTNLSTVGSVIGSYYNNNPVKIKADLVVGGKPYDQGGTVGPHGGVAGEIGPEFIATPDGRTYLVASPTPVAPGTKVTSRSRTRQILRGRAPAAHAAGASSVRVDLESVAAVERRLAQLTRRRTARIDVAAVPSSVLVRVNGGG